VGLNGWEVSRGTTFANMFSGALNFNGDVSSWDVANSTDFSGMFKGAKKFNQDISKWVMSSKCRDFSGMFDGVELFNADIGSWNTEGGTDFVHMFARTGTFNRDIGKWNVARGTDFAGMFKDALSFNQDLHQWRLNAAHDMQDMFTGSAFHRNIQAWRRYPVFNSYNPSDSQHRCPCSGASLQASVACCAQHRQNFPFRCEACEVLRLVRRRLYLGVTRAESHLLLLSWCVALNAAVGPTFKSSCEASRPHGEMCL